MKYPVAMLLLSTAFSVNAQEMGRVISATPIIQQVGVPQQYCGQETVYGQPRTSGAGAVLGAVAGGAAGNAIGKGSGRAAATALGVIGGAVLGNHIEGQGRPSYETVQRGTTETHYENRTVGYQVVYEYAGRQYTTRTQTDPGNWLPVWVQPATDRPGRVYSTQPDPYAAYTPPAVTTYPVAPVYIQGPTVIEYSSPGYRPYPPPSSHANPYWR